MTSKPVFVAALTLAFAGAASAQDIFTTRDYRQDRALWSSPAYYRGNTIRAMADMAEQTQTYGQQGPGTDEIPVVTPYAFKTSEEHFQAWLRAANGGTKHTLATLPNWDGQWRGNEGWLSGERTQASTLAAALTPQYREYFVQQEKAEAEGRNFWPAAFCLPRGFIEAFVSTPKEFIIRPNTVYILGATYTENPLRWVYTDGSGHAPEDKQFPKWHGESIAFWDNDALVIHTNQIRRWKTARRFEWSDNMTAVERYRRIGDTIEGEMTLYDTEAFVQPLHVKLT